MYNIDKYKLQQELERDEGSRDTMYYDTADVPTIGIGHNLYEPIPQQAIDVIFQHDLSIHIAYCEQLMYWQKLSATRKRVIANMMFNLGPKRLGQFKKMHQCLKSGDFQGAADEMMDSKWYKQVGRRAERLVAAMRFNDERYLREGLV